MKQTRKSGKRIVSKGEYALAQARQAQKRILGNLALMLGIMSAVMAALCGCVFLGCVLGLLATGDFRFLLPPLLSVSLPLLLSGRVAYLSLRWGFAAIYALENVEVVPLTRANIGALPAVESLVRAASEPLQAQEGVLLRAAMGETPQKQETELVRASSET